MPVYRCKMCGATLSVAEDSTTCTCDFCDSTQTIPLLSDEKKINLFNRANRLRAKCEFDAAEAVYQNLVSEFSEESEAYWGLCLCKFGIEYVEDPLSGKMIPTCNRTMYESIFEDVDYLSAIKYSDSQSQLLYQTEARHIDEIQKKILQVAKNETPYDVFICYSITTLSPLIVIYRQVMPNHRKIGAFGGRKVKNRAITGNRKNRKSEDFW